MANCIFFPSIEGFEKHLKNYNDVPNSRKTSFFWLAIDTTGGTLLTGGDSRERLVGKTLKGGHFVGENITTRAIGDGTIGSGVIDNINTSSWGNGNALTSNPIHITVLVFPASSPYEIMTVDELLAIPRTGLPTISRR